MRVHFEGRVRMNLIEVFERRSQLAHNCLGISPIHSADVIPFEGVDEALSHAVALRTADGCADGRKAQLFGQCLGLAGNVCAAVIRQELQSMIGHLLVDILKQLVIVSRLAMTATVLPVLRASQALVDIRPRYA